MVTIEAERPGIDEVLPLYETVGWSAYTRDPDTLEAALAGSHEVLVARGPRRTGSSSHGGRGIVGLVRTVSDGVTIVYVQDLLVHPDVQRQGVGGRLLDEVLRRYATVRQTVLLTDDEPGQRAFYESRGFVEAHDVGPGALRSFVLLH